MVLALARGEPLPRNRLEPANDLTLRGSIAPIPKVSEKYPQ
ncbi:hypothetical protein [Nonomuraea rosea]